MEKQKVVHVLYSGLGGHGNVFFSLIEANEDKHILYEAIFNGVEPIRDEYLKKCEALDVSWAYVHKSKTLDFAYYYKIFKLLTSSNAGLIFLHSSTLFIPAKVAALLAKRRKRILVRETQATHLLTKRAWVFMKISLALADNIVFLTEEYRNAVQVRSPFLYKRNKRKINIIANGIDINKFAPPAASKPQPVLTFSMQSRLVSIKDYSTLIKAFALYRQQANDASAILKIAGEGPDRQSLELLAKDLNVAQNVFFVGLLNEQELINFLNTTDIYIHATFGETMSTAVMQAMACRLPIIASDVPGIKNMIAHLEDGLLVAVKSVEELAQEMSLLATDRGLRERLAQQAYRKAIRDYSSGRMSEKYTAVMDNLS